MLLELSFPKGHKLYEKYAISFKNYADYRELQEWVKKKKYATSWETMLIIKKCKIVLNVEKVY